MSKLFYCKCKVFFSDLSKICSFGNVLTKKTICVFVCPALPSGIGIGEVNRKVGFIFYLFEITIKGDILYGPLSRKKRLIFNYFILKYILDWCYFRANISTRSLSPVILVNDESLTTDEPCI